MHTTFWYTDIQQSTRVVVRKRLGGGTYGDVYKAQRRDDGEYVAVKRSKVEFDYDIPAADMIREVAILKLLRGHRNILEYKDQEEMRWAIYEYVPRPLNDMIVACPELITAYRYKLIRGLFDGLRFCHRKGVIHRDIKPSNILVDDQTMELKIADFGLSKVVNQKGFRLMTPKVCTIWYRAPELLTGSCTDYGPGIDIWAAGCVTYEIAYAPQTALFPGENDIDMLRRIEDAFRDNRAWLIRITPGTWGYFIRDVLAYSASERLSAEQCLRIMDDYKCS